MEESKMKKHVQVVGGLQIGFGVLWLMLAVVVYFVLNFARSQVYDDEIGRQVLTFIAYAVPAFMAFMSVLGIVGGVALLSYKGWARILVIIVSGLACLNIPIGTLVGVYSIWTLMQDDTMILFKQ
jgi:quinol-cytochrome oxidoreductase complex cytochrome b subunit